MIPDRVDGAPNGRDVLGVSEHRVSLFGNPHAGELARQVREVGDLDAGDVVDFAGIVAVAVSAHGIDGFRFAPPILRAKDECASSTYSYK